MATDETLLTLALELAAEWDPDLDTSEGSPFRTTFLTPLLERVGPSPLDGDLEAFLVSRLETEIPDVDVSPLSGMRNLVIRAALIMLEPLRREIRAVKLAQSLQNYQSMTKDEINALLANYFTEIQEGAVSTGTVRMYFPTPRTVTVTPLTQFSTGSGLNFFPTVAQSLSSSQMSFNQDGSLFYMDVQVQAENPGDEYNIEPDSITSVSGITGYSRVTNLGKFTNGLKEETKDEAVARTRNSITIRNLITDRGVKFVLPESFPAVDTVQVIGYGDPEMERDVVSGPVDISNIPGGLTGIDDPGLAGGEQIHIGGKTDVYVYQATPDADDVDIQDLTDKGFRVFAGVHGYTDAGSATAVFKDDYGFFDKRGVVAGDLLLLDDTVYTILSVATTSLTLTATMAAAQFGKTYEIVRKVSGFVTVPLYDLVAEDSLGAPVIDDADDPIASIPGSLTKAPLVVGGVQVKKKDVDWANIARSNVQMPLLRVVTVERLDPLTLEGSGIFIPMRDPLLAVALTDFTGGTVSTAATGKVRVYFREALNAWVKRDTTRFVLGALSFRPIAEEVSTTFSSTGSGTLGGNTITLSGGDLTSTGSAVFLPGYRIQITSGAGAGTYTVLSTAFSSPNTILTIREDLPATFAGSTWTAFVGVAESSNQVDVDLNLAYLDVDVECMTNGTNGNVEMDTAFDSIQSLNSEGWSLETTHSVTSFSTKELPYLQLSEWVNDDEFLGDVLDAPAIRVSYEYASSLQEIQAFADHPDNRVVSEDVLIRHFLPSYVRMVGKVKGITGDEASAQVTSFINELDPTSEFDVSDMVTDLQSVAKATKVQLPLFVVALSQDASRAWIGRIDQDTLGSSRIQHFIADIGAITFTPE